jgi:hypothetical protein
LTRVLLDAVQGRRDLDLDAPLQAARAELECRESAAGSS